MDEQKPIEQDWRNDITPSAEVLKVKDGESVEVTFANEGEKKSHPDFGDSIQFLVMEKDKTEPKKFFVKANNYSLLAQIKELGKLIGIRAKITRVGSKKSDTRYSIKKI